VFSVFFDVVLAWNSGTAITLHLRYGVLMKHVSHYFTTVRRMEMQFSPLSRVEVMYVVSSVSLISVIVPRPSSVI
jgi:hypothetical protein